MAHSWLNRYRYNTTGINITFFNDLSHGANEEHHTLAQHTLYYSLVKGKHGCQLADFFQAGIVLSY